MISSNIITLGFLCTVTVICALPAQEQGRNLDTTSNHIQTENDLLESVHMDCLQHNTMACIKYKIYNFVDKALNVKDVNVINGLQIVKTGNDNEQGGAPRALSADDTIETVIMNRVQRFISSHSIKYEFKGSDLANTIDAAARSLSTYEIEEEEDDDNDGLVEEGRGKKKKIKKVVKKLGPILPLIAMKAAMLFKLGVAAVALLAGKAFMVAKIALLLAALNGIGKLLGGGGGGGGYGGGGHHEVEVVAHHGHHEHEVHHDVGGHGGHGGHGGWGRSMDAQQMAYRGHEQATR